MSWTPQEAARAARTLIHQAGDAALGTLSSDGSPHVSQVACATMLDGAPLILISELAVHTRNIARDPRASLLFRTDEADDAGDANALARVSVDGMLHAVDDPEAARTRFLRRQPASADYASFGDFRFMRLEPKRARIVAGFGRIANLAPADLLASAANTAAIAAMEDGACRHMDEDHADAMALMAEFLAGRPGEPCCAVGLDALGIDIGCAGRVVRVEYDAPATTGIEVRKALVELTKRARQRKADLADAASAPPPAG